MSFEKFVIVDPSTGIYFAKNHKIILFENEHDAVQFAQQFCTYARERMAQENPQRLIEVGLYFPRIQKWDNKSVGAETILFSELKP